MSTSICPKFEYAVKILGKRWNGLIIHQLLEDKKRFNELENEINISAKVLSQRLKELEKEQLINRIVFNEMPVRIEYSLTEKGQSLSQVMDDIQLWANDWIK